MGLPYQSENYDDVGGASTSESSSAIIIDTEADATSVSAKTAQTVGTSIFYQNGSQLRVQYKASASSFQDILIGAFDLTNPTITVLGNNPESVQQSTTYTDAGATANDNKDGDITSDIQTVITDSGGNVVSSVDTSTVGATFTVTYSVSDTAGNSASSTRTVNVITPSPTPTYQWDFTQGSMPSNAVAVGTVSFASDGMTTTTTNHARLYSSGTSDFAPSFFDEFSIEFEFKTATLIDFCEYFTLEQPQSTYGTVPNRLEGRLFGGGIGYGWSDLRFTIRDYYHKTSAYSNGRFNGSDATPSANTFFNVIYTHKNNPSGTASRKLYINGTLQTSSGIGYGGNGDLPTTGNNYAIKIGTVDGGSPNGSDTWKFFRIYNTELTATDVQTLNAP